MHMSTSANIVLIISHYKKKKIINVSSSDTKMKIKFINAISHYLKKFIIIKQKLLRLLYFLKN